MLFTFAAFGAPAATPEQPRSGTIEFSDGKTLTGKITLTPGSELKLHVGNQLKVLALDRIKEMKMFPEKESMEQGYRFIEAGKAIKENLGQPYPVRLLTTQVILAGGETLRGHLYTTVLYVEGEENAQKVILLAKQRGKEGETLESLVYPVKITFAEVANEVPAAIRLRVKLPGVGPGARVGALVRGSLVQVEIKAADSGEYLLASPLGKEVFLAVEAGQKIYVGWPRQADTGLAMIVRNAMPNSEDFFDRHKLLGVFRDEASADIYSLILASREGKTTLEQTRSQPWRLEVHRWKQEADSQRVMLASQGYFFRGIEASGSSGPTVELTELLWNPKKSGNLWVVGAE